MIILNTVKEKGKGVWTRRRVQREEKSITDYVLTDASSANTVEEMKIVRKNNMDYINQRKIQKTMKIKRYSQITTPL